MPLRHLGWDGLSLHRHEWADMPLHLHLLTEIRSTTVTCEEVFKSRRARRGEHCGGGARVWHGIEEGNGNGRRMNMWYLRTRI